MPTPESSRFGSIATGCSGFPPNSLDFTHACCLSLACLLLCIGQWQADRSIKLKCLALTFNIILRHEVQTAICISQEEERGQARPPSPKERTQDETRMASFPLDQEEQNSREDAHQCCQERTSSDGFFETELLICASTAEKTQEEDEGARPGACKSSPMLIEVAQIVAALVLLALTSFILLSFRLRLRVPLVV